MDVSAFPTGADRVEADLLGVLVADPPELSAAAAELDGALGGALGRLLAEGDVTGRRGSVTVLHRNGDPGPRRVAVAGLGPVDRAGAEAVRLAAAATARRLGEAGGRTVAWLLDPGGAGVAPGALAGALVDGLVLGPHSAARWRSSGPPPDPVERLVLVGPDAEAALDEARRAAAVARWTNRCRDLVNAPASDLTPTALAAAAEEIAASVSTLEAAVLGPGELADAGLGSFLSVARGSHEEPRLIVLRHEPTAAETSHRLGLVGKAITFDSGGLSLKPPESLQDMKTDMAGGAAAVTGLAALAELEVPLCAFAVVAATENMPSGHATRPGDVVRAADGTTIEINDTDAEGRLVLADALLHARTLEPTHLLDLATLTGTIEIALGDVYGGLYGNDPHWIERVRAAGERAGDRVWPMPTDADYDRYLESHVADLKNTPERKRGSSSIAARFLARFAGDGPWAHLDIAAVAAPDRARGMFAQPGASGFGVRLIAELARDLAR
jgi:leucyl aminopeptidase